MNPVNRLFPVESRILRIEQNSVRDLVLVIRCGKAYKVRFKIAMAIMKIAAKIGGFRFVTVVRKRAR